MARGVVAVDLDEVLGQFIPQLCQFYNDNVSRFAFATKKKLEPSSFFSYRFSEVWGGTDAQSLEIVEPFFDSAYFRDMPLVPGAVEGVKALKASGYELVVVTSRQLFLEQITNRWVHEKFANCFSRIVFGNHWGTTGRKISKPDLCQELGASVIIDDAVSYCRQCAQAGMRSFLFGEYAWNRNDDANDPLPASIRRVTNWEEVVKALDHE